MLIVVVYELWSILQGEIRSDIITSSRLSEKHMHLLRVECVSPWLLPGVEPVYGHSHGNLRYTIIHHHLSGKVNRVDRFNEGGCGRGQRILQMELKKRRMGIKKGIGWRNRWR